MSDSEGFYDSDKDVSENHSKLIEAVSQLDKGQRVKKPERSEPTLEVSEFHLVKSGISDKDTVQVNDLAKVLGKKGHHLEITKRLEATKKKAKILTKPLEKPAADRIKRIVGFENTKKELKKWNAVITKNRTAESLKFPLNQPALRLEPTNQFLKRFRLQSDLEKELAALEPQKENIEQKDDEFTKTLEEVVSQRKEAARFRAQQSYKEAKAHRQRKIKSKKFHRVQRKEKIKQQLKEFEELQKTDPEAALSKLEELDKSRAEERMSLRHKSTGQWAKNKQIRAKYDKDTRQELAQQLSISRELTQKIKKPDDSEEENEENENAAPQISASDKENPWVNNTKTETEIDQFIKGYRQYWDEQKNQNGNQTSNNNDRSGIDRERLKPSIENLNPVSNVEEVDSNTNSNTQSTEIQNHEDTTEVTKPHDVKSTEKEFVVEDLRPKSSVKVSSLKKKAKSSGKKSQNLVFTSAWTVESIEAEDSPKSKNLDSEKISEMFDVMEEKLQNEVEMKLNDFKQKFDKVTTNSKKNKRKSKDRRNGNTTEFDGLEIKSKKQRPDLDTPLDESTRKNNSEPNTAPTLSINTGNVSSIPASKSKETVAEIDPNKYINVKPKHLFTDLPDITTGGDDTLDDSENEAEKHNIISEAFADDDVVEEFRKEKEDVVKKGQPKDIDLTLPGWGNWGGKNLKVSTKKKKRFILKFPKEAPRRDENKGGVIIIEENNPKIREHQVNDLPYPFTRVKDFEASVRMPIGRNFVPENAHRKLIEPTIKTSLGKVIQPMDEDVLVKLPNRKQRKSFLKKKGSKTKKNKMPKKIGNAKK